MQDFKFDKVNWRYKVSESICLYCGITGFDYRSDYIVLQRDGTLKLTDRYAWDGATCAVDTPSIMLASAVHDALYQLLRIGVLPQEMRIACDRQLFHLMLRCGATQPRARYVYAAVRLFGGRYAKPA